MTPIQPEAWNPLLFKKNLARFFQELTASSGNFHFLIEAKRSKVVKMKMCGTLGSSGNLWLVSHLLKTSDYWSNIKPANSYYQYSYSDGQSSFEDIGFSIKHWNCQVLFSVFFFRWIRAKMIDVWMFNFTRSQSKTCLTSLSTAYCQAINRVTATQKQSNLISFENPPWQ